eukprot:3716612-Rhodomonas_salina.1
MTQAQFKLTTLKFRRRGRPQHPRLHPIMMPVTDDRVRLEPEKGLPSLSVRGSDSQADTTFFCKVLSCT